MARLGLYTLILLVCSSRSSCWAVAAQEGNSDCAVWCAANFANPGKDCTSQAAHGAGPCYECGPKRTSPTMQLCNGVCTNTNTDSSNCGACGKACPTGSSPGFCRSGECVCYLTNLPPCGDICCFRRSVCVAPNLCVGNCAGGQLHCGGPAGPCCQTGTHCDAASGTCIND